MRKLFRKSPTRFAKRMLIANYDKIRWLIPDKYFVFSIPGGKIYLNVKESSMMLERSLGLYEQAKVTAVRAFLKPGGTFIDVGANKGDFALLAAKIVGESGKVICVEPDLTNSTWIRRSIDLNGYKNITLCDLALSDRDGEATLYLGAKSGFHTLLRGAPERDLGSRQVRTRRVDSLLEELGMQSVDVMKIDVEGAELQVLKGAVRTLRTNPDVVLLIDIHPLLGVNPSQVFEFLQSLGLTACHMQPPYNLPTTPLDSIYDVVAKRL
jgi:FkbM family methyltransferase